VPSSAAAARVLDEKTETKTFYKIVIKTHFPKFG
jgi:hypothetical protein